MKISYGKQYIDKADKVAVTKALSSDFITQGKYVENFEGELKKIFKSKYVCAVSSGTAGMHLIAKALNWGKNDIILMSAVTFVSTANIVEHLGAKLDLIDIDENTYNIDIDKLEKKIKFYKSQKKNIKAVVATDYAGLPCEWKKLKQLSEIHSFKIINDNCHAIGAEYKGKLSYGAKYAIASIHSYHPVKNITTGEGGAIFTNNKEIYYKIKKLRSHGIEKRGKNNILWYYDISSIGFNYRINDFQCALGISQLNKLNKFLKRRRYVAKYYFQRLKNLKFLKLPQAKYNRNHAYHLFPVQINFNKIKLDKKKFFLFFKKKNISLQVHYIPIYRLTYFKKKYNFLKNNFPNSEKFYKSVVSLPIFYTIKENQLNKIINLIKGVEKKNENKF